MIHQKEFGPVNEFRSKLENGRRKRTIDRSFEPNGTPHKPSQARVYSSSADTTTVLPGDRDRTMALGSKKIVDPQRDKVPEPRNQQAGHQRK
eukprot:scaffold2438_cov167-Amphora_coffeaeformis.AAC.6